MTPEEPAPGWMKRVMAMLVVVAFLLLGFVAWRDQAPRKFNPATYCTDQANGHPQKLPPGLAIDCQGP